jgi:hypothetical protein
MAVGGRQANETMFSVLISFIAVSSNSVVPLQEAVNSLTRQIGKPCLVLGALRRERVFVEPHGAAPTVVLSALAASLHASIHQTTNGLVFERTTADLTEMRRSREADRANWISDRLEKVRKFRVDKTKRGAPDQVFFDALDHQADQIAQVSHGKRNDIDPFYAIQLLPSEVVLEELISRIGPAKLAEAPSGTVVVYEDSPVEGANPLPLHDDLDKAYEQSMQAFQNIQISQIEAGRLKALSLSDALVGWFGVSEVVTLRLEEEAEDTQILFKLEGFNAKGGRTALAYFAAGPTASLRMPNLTIRATEKDPHSSWIRISDAGLDVIKFTKNETLMKLPDWYLHPDKIEPLNLFVREALGNIASETPNQPVVIVAADSLWPNTAQCLQGDRINTYALEEVIAEWSPFERVESLGAIIWRPKDEEYCEASNADRTALAEYARSLEREGHADTLSAVRLYTDSNTYPGSLSNAWFFDGQLASGRQVMSCNLGRSFYHLLGEIPQEGWDRLMSCQTEGCAELGIEDAMESFLKNDAYLRTEGVTSDLLRHPNEVLAETVRDLPIKFEVSTDQQIDIIQPGRFNSGWSSLDRLKADFYLRPYDFTWANDQPVIKTTREEFEQQFADRRYQLGQMRTITVTIGLARGAYVLGKINEIAIPSGEPFGYADFPQEFRDAAWNRACQLGMEDEKRRHEDFFGSHPLVPPAGQRPNPAPSRSSWINSPSGHSI